MFKLDVFAGGYPSLGVYSQASSSAHADTTHDIAVSASVGGCGIADDALCDVADCHASVADAVARALGDELTLGLGSALGDALTDLTSLDPWSDPSTCSLSDCAPEDINPDLRRGLHSG